MTGRTMREDGIFFDDIGSYPMPKGVRRENLDRNQYLQLVRDVLARKSAAGVEVPTYPQFRDMIRMFMDPIEDPKLTKSPYLIAKENAKILELEAAAPGQKLRVCVTGPVELYISAFGATNYTDILFNLAKSVALFLENAKEAGVMAVASLDEPSLGMSSNIVFSEDEILEALEIVSAPCRGMDSEIHLHSPLYAEPCARVSGISIVGIESAANPDYLLLIDKKVLEETDTYLRAGIARTDILAITARLNDKLGVNLWGDMPRLEAEVLQQESAQVMRKRLDAAYRRFGTRLRATGPDCGLGSWPSQDLADRILANCSTALNEFRKDAGH
ncbi:MAG: 5-methyltetrahydropteroyltriglutamate--homocysteine methyltransferase [Methanothrix sp.]|nr:5-methyltetrahydropteroyltriglutamate--homocysteine methyltransferase [Methanothrix sp.]